MKVVTASEMRQVDAWAIDRGGVPSLTLMERAGRGVAESVARRFQPIAGTVVVAVCGRGNNGGDGLVAARVLEERGARTRVVLVGAVESLSPDAREMHARYLHAGGTVTEVVPEDPDVDLALERALAGLEDARVVIDALLGTGSSGPPRGSVARAVERIAAAAGAGVPVVAIDMPTGVNADDGGVNGAAVPAACTVTLGLWKRGLVLYPGRALAGAVEAVVIGLPADAWSASSPPLPDLADAALCAPLLPCRAPTAHKGSAGRVLVVGGSSGMLGAVALAARAALRAGAGLVTAVVPRSLQDALATKVTEPTTLGVAETPSRALAADGLPAILRAAERADVIALGPGLGRDPSSLDLVRSLIDAVGVPVVLDADGLFALAGIAAPGSSARARGTLVLTPHVAEMARLAKTTPEDVEARRFDVARETATRLGLVLLLKGAPTVTGAPDGRLAVNTTGNPGMATGGSGDVLTGVIAALIGQRVPPYEAAVLGAYLHGAAGDAAAFARGVMGLIAGDIVEALPAATLALERTGR